MIKETNSIKPRPDVLKWAEAERGHEEIVKELTQQGHGASLNEIQGTPDQRN